MNRFKIFQEKLPFTTEFLTIASFSLTGIVGSNRIVNKCFPPLSTSITVLTEFKLHKANYSTVRTLMVRVFEVKDIEISSA